jgi:hypothetical protein
MRKARLIGCMLTHLPHIAVGSFPLLLRIDLLIIFISEGQKSKLQDLLDRLPLCAKPNILIITHRIELKNGVPQMGLLRYEQQDLLQRHMRENDVGILLDHDIKLGAARFISSNKLRQYNEKEDARNAFWEKCGVQSIKPNWGKRRAALSSEQKVEFERLKLGTIYSYPLSPTLFRTRALKLGAAMLQRGFDFGSFGYANAAHNSRAIKGDFCAVATWSGLVFLLKHSPNFYDVAMTIGSDADVQFHIIASRKKLGVLSDPCTVVQMELKKEKYQDGGAQHIARLKNRDEIMTRYPNLCRPVQGRDIRCGLEHLKYTGFYGKE